MNAAGKRSLLNFTGALAVLVGLLLTLNTARALPGHQRHLARKASDLEQLRTWRAEADHDHAAMETFEQLPRKRPARLTLLASETIEYVKPEIHERGSEALPSGWSLREMDVVFSKVSLADLERFIRHAEQQRPPWRLRECTITASGVGTGRATLVMATVEKATP